MKETLLGWTKSTRSIAVILTFVLLFVVIVGNKIPADKVSDLMTFITGLVIGGYFADRKPQMPDQSNP